MTSRVLCNPGGARLAHDTQPRREVVALLLTDVVDSTRSAEVLGDLRTAELWAAHNRVARDLLRKYDGREIDKTDGFLLMFAQADAALGYVREYHAALAGLNPPMSARAGLHVGEVILTPNRPDDIARGAKPMEVDGLAKPMAARVMALATGGQTLLTHAALQALSPGSDVRSYGHWRLKGVHEPLELFGLGGSEPRDQEKAHRVLRSGQGTWTPVRTVRNSLPAERDAFVGRRDELRSVSDLLERARLVTVMGLGGAGKTRLAVRAGREQLGARPGGVWFCDLAEARDRDGIARAVGAGLRVPLGEGDPVEQLGHAIAGRGRCLVVLDNFEQVVDWAFETVGRWLDRAANACFLVTTRERLGVVGEHLLVLPQLTGGDALGLFATRAAQVRPEFALNDGNRSAVSALVDLLDGLPLAIELAAARMAESTAERLLGRMSARFDVLSGPAGRHPRHATLRAMLDWSWDLLEPELKLALTQLSVFEGGFTADAVSRIVDLPTMFPEDALEGLFERSLVRRVSDSRFDLLVSVHAFAAEKLGDPGVVARHAAYYSDHATAGEQGIELDNLVAAVRRSVERGELDVALRAYRGAYNGLRRRGPASIALSLAQSLVDASVGPSHVDARRYLAASYKLLARHAEAQSEYEAVVEGYRELGDREGEGQALSGLAGVNLYQGKSDVARSYYQQALLIHREFGDRASEGIALCGLANVEITHGDAESAPALFDQALAIQRADGDVEQMAVTLANYGASLKALGRLEESTLRNTEALELHRQLGDRKFESLALSNIGTNAVHLGRLDEAEATLKQSLAIAREVGARRQEGTAQIMLGNLALQRGRLEEAARNMEDALDFHREVGARTTEGILLGNLGNIRRRQQRLSEAVPLLTQALAIHRQTKFRRGQAHWCSVLARVASAHGLPQQALDWAREAVELADPFPNVLVAALVSMAEARLASGDVPGARGAVGQAVAIGWSGEIGAEAHAMQALVAATAGDRDGAEEALTLATADPQLCAPGTSVAELATRVRELLD